MEESEKSAIDQANKRSNASVSVTKDKQHAQEQKSKLAKLADKTENILFEASTVFPFTLFPDTVIIDRTKVTVVIRNFFYTKRYFSLLLEDVRVAHVSTIPFFGTLTIEMKGLELRDYKKDIHFLRRGDAVRAQRIITGLITAREEEGVDLTVLSDAEVARLAEDIGMAQEEKIVSYKGPPELETKM
jgi:hypothetical protein